MFRHGERRAVDALAVHGDVRELVALVRRRGDGNGSALGGVGEAQLRLAAVADDKLNLVRVGDVDDGAEHGADGHILGGHGEAVAADGHIPLNDLPAREAIAAVGFGGEGDGSSRRGNGRGRGRAAVAVGQHCYGANHLIAGHLAGQGAALRNGQNAVICNRASVCNDTTVVDGHATGDGQRGPLRDGQALVRVNGQILLQFYTAVHGALAVFKDDAVFFIDCFAADRFAIVTSRIGADNGVAVDGDLSGFFSAGSFREDAIAASTGRAAGGCNGGVFDGNLNVGFCIRRGNPAAFAVGGSAAGGCNGGVLDGDRDDIVTRRISRANTEAVTGLCISACACNGAARDFNFAHSVNAAAVLDIRPCKGAALTHHGAALDCKYVIAANAAAQFSCAADACDIAAGDGQVIIGKKAATTIDGSASGIPSRGSNGTAVDDDIILGTNTETITVGPGSDSIPSRGSNGTAVDCENASANAKTKLGFPTRGSNNAAVNRKVAAGVHTVTERMSGIARGGNNAVGNGDTPIGSNAHTITVISFPTRGDNSTAVNRERTGRNAVTISDSITTRGGNGAALNGDRARGANAVTERGRGLACDGNSTAVDGDGFVGINAAAITICCICGIATINRQRGTVLAAYGETAAAQIDAAAGGSSVARRVHGVLAHQHKVHVAGREVNSHALMTVSIFLCLLNRRVSERQGCAVPHDVVVFGGCTICCDGAGGCVRGGVN